MNLQEHIRKVLREESLKQKLQKMIKDDGIRDTISIVGGIENLIHILGDDTVLDVLIGYFDDLKLSKFRDELHLSQKYNTFIEKTSGLFTGGYIKVFDDHLQMVLKDVPESMYKQYRRDLLKELISRYFELDKKTEVIVFADRGLYRRLDKFYMNDDEI
jgi:small nuclear ribonucleoprotein (snRNP)-like protein